MDQERVGVDGGGQVVVLLPLLFGVEERELGQREEDVEGKEDEDDAD